MNIDQSGHYQMVTKDDVLQAVAEHDIQFIAFWFTDITGVAKSVMTPVQELEGVIDSGLSIDGSSIEGFARVAESDMLLVPDLSTFSILPWTQDEEKTAVLICNIYSQNGEPFIGDPRSTLIRALHQAEEMGYVYKTGMELEFFLFRTDADKKPVLEHFNDNASYFDIPDDPIRSIRRRMMDALNKVGIRVESTHSENGYGQHEIIIHPNNALVSADAILMARVVLKTIARNHDLYCTFMPRPSADMPGSGMHTHQALYLSTTGENVFHDNRHEYKLSEVAQYFLAGQLAHAQAITAIVAPLVNSYKRLGTSFEAPVYITWAHVNRGALIRVPGTIRGGTGTRLEMRSPDAANNPYLMMAVMLQAGLDGIQNRLPLPEPLEETLLVGNRGRLRHLQTLPQSLGEALDCLRQDDVVLAALGPYISDRYIDAKRQEFEEYSQSVSQWELDQYLNRF